MKRKLSNSELAGLCCELALLMHAGVQLGDGLALLAEEEKDAALRSMLKEMANQADMGVPLSAALREAGCFPLYVTGLVEVGERTGRTEEALRALSQYYESRERTDRQIKSALTYPAILLVMMLVVIGVLLSQVLPVFEDVYASLGGRLTGFAGGLLVIGRWLDAAMPFVCAILVVVIAFFACFYFSLSFRDKVLGIWRKRFGDKGVSRKISDARFAQALAMGLRSGLPLEETVDLAAELLKDTPAAVERCKACRAKLDEGADLAEAMRSADTLPAAQCRLLHLGLRSGEGDSVMEDIARRLSEEAELAMEKKVSKIEPAMVLVTSLLVGVILLSVMLPLMNIMAAIG